MHQRVCREANVMARSSAFDASFCSRSIISILVQQKPGDGISRKRLEMPLIRLKQCHERRKLLVERANLNLELTTSEFAASTFAISRARFCGCNDNWK
jgi:hypothetical protein